MKRMKLMALMLVVVLAFSGCMKVDMKTVINADGSAVATVTMDLDKQAYIKGMGDMMGTPMTEAEIAEMEKGMLADGSALVTVDGKEYYRTTETQSIKAGELSKTFAGENSTAFVTADTVYIVMTAQEAATNQNMGMDMSGMDMSGLDLTGMAVTISFEFAAPITSTNGVIDPTNPKAVTFTMSMTETNDVTLFATTKAGVSADSVKAEVVKLNEVKDTKIKKLKVDKAKKTAKKATATLKFKKVKGAENYEIQYSLKKNFKNAKTYTTKKLTYKLKNLKKGKKYFVRVRASKKNYAGQTVYGKWSKKTLKVKK